MSVPANRSLFRGCLAALARFAPMAGLAGVFLAVSGFEPVLVFFVVDGRFFNVLGGVDRLTAEDAAFFFFAARFHSPVELAEVDF